MQKFSQILRYFVSGCTTAVVLFVSLILFREVLGFWYLYASTLAFCLALVTSFILQKFWTFRNVEHKNIQKQFMVFLMVSLCNLAVNATLMYVSVDILAVPYLFAQ